MKKLNKKRTNTNISMEAFGIFADCYCRCGCERAIGSQNLGISYFSMDSKSVSNFNDTLGFWGAYDYYSQGKYVR